MSKLTSRNFRKFIAGAALAAVVAPVVAPATGLAAANFPDVEGDYVAAVEFLATKGIQGKLDGTFGTHENITRQDAAIFVAKALELDTKKTPDAGFTDVNPRAVGAVNALKAKGITNGKGDTTFGGGDLITRGELAKWIAAAFDLKAENAKKPFSDVEGHYVDAVKALVENEVTLGKTVTTFGTHENATRGQFALFVYRAANAQNIPHPNDNGNNNGVTPPPAGGPGTSEGDQTPPTLESATLIFGNKQKVAIKDGDSWVVSLSGLDPADKLTSIKVDSNEPGTASITIGNLLHDEKSLVNGTGSFEVKDLTYNLYPNGIAVSELKELLGSYGSNITGTIADENDNSTSIKVVITKD